MFDQAFVHEAPAIAAEAIAALHPDFMSVTYGAGGGTSDFTVHIASAVKKTYGVEVMPHLTCLSRR